MTEFELESWRRQLASCGAVDSPTTWINEGRLDIEGVRCKLGVSDDGSSEGEVFVRLSADVPLADIAQDWKLHYLRLPPRFGAWGIDDQTGHLSLCLRAPALINADELTLWLISCVVYFKESTEDTTKIHPEKKSAALRALINAHLVENKDVDGEQHFAGQKKGAEWLRQVVILAGGTTELEEVSGCLLFEVDGIHANASTTKPGFGGDLEIMLCSFGGDSEASLSRVLACNGATNRNQKMSWHLGGIGIGPSLAITMAASPFPSVLEASQLLKESVAIYKSEVKQF